MVQDRGRVLCGIVSFTVKAQPAAGEVKAWLAAQEPPINVSMHRPLWLWRHSMLWGCLYPAHSECGALLLCG